MSRFRFSIPLIIGIFICLPNLLVQAQPISARVVAPRGVSPGTIIEITVNMTSQRQLGGLDLTLHYNDSLFGFISVEQDTGLRNWEYFNTYHSADSDYVNIFTIADILNGAIHPDSLDFYPKGSIARYSFFVAPNWTSDSSQQEFGFFWRSCGDNAASNRRGDTLILLNRVYSGEGVLIWNEPDNVNYPESLRLPNIGTPDDCLSAADKVLFSIDFKAGNAANYYICGDADGNDAVSISDVVLIIRYIFAGGSPPNPLQSGDVNCNSIVSISDVVYLLSYIFGGGPGPCAACP